VQPKRRANFHEPLAPASLLSLCGNGRVDTVADYEAAGGWTTMPIVVDGQARDGSPCG
jgi:hypothetical protein